jgi:hypothetical protein
MPRWFDDGVRLGLSVSESGDFVSLGTRTEYPFTSGGANGVPLNWNPNFSAAINLADLNITTANGRFSVSNRSTTNAYIGAYFGLWRDFPVTVGKRYVLWTQVRTMADKAGGTWSANYTFNGQGTIYGMRGTTAQDWEQFAQYMLPPAGTTFIRVFNNAEYRVPAGQTTRFDWGIQWQNPVVIEYESSYPDPVWRDVTCDVKALTVAYGRSKFTGRFDVASAEITVDNNDGEFTYQTVHPWGLRPGRFVKVYATKDNLTYPMYYGLIDSISDSFPIDGRVTAVMRCVDTSTLLANTTVPTAQDYAITTLSGLRFRHMLDTVAWNPSKRFFDNGVYYQQAVLQNGRTIRDELGLIADSEGSLFWCDRDGVLTYRDRTYLDRSPRAYQVQAELMATCAEYMDEVKFIFPGVNGNGMTVPYQSSFDLTPSVHVEARVSFVDISSAARQAIAGQNGRWEFRKVGGNKRLEFTNGSGVATSTVDMPINSGVAFWAACNYNIANGTVDFYTGLPGNAYAKLGATVSITGTMPVNQNGLQIGGNGNGLLFPFNGELTGLLVGNGTTTALEIRPESAPGTAGATAFTAITGQIVTVVQTGTNEIIQVDPSIPPYRLIPVDPIANADRPAVVNLRAFEPDWSRDRVINDVQIANQGGAAFQQIDYDSQSKYGPRTYQRLDFLNDNAHPEYAQQRITDYLDGWTDSVLRVNRVTFVPTEDTYAWALLMFLTDLVRVRYQHPTQGWGFAVVTHIQGYVHTLTTRGWETGLNLDQPESFVFWDTPPNAATGWDTDFWDEGIWDNDDPNAAYWTSGQVWSDSESKWSA